MNLWETTLRITVILQENPVCHFKAIYTPKSIFEFIPWGGRNIAIKVKKVLYVTTYEKERSCNGLIRRVV